MEYRTLETEIIHNIHNVQFYELELDGKRLFSEFIEDLTDAKDKKTFIAIATIMDNFSFNQKLPKEKFRPIKISRGKMCMNSRKIIFVYMC